MTEEKEDGGQDVTRLREKKIEEMSQRRRLWKAAEEEEGKRDNRKSREDAEQKTGGNED